MARGLADDNALLNSHLATRTEQRAAARRLLNTHCDQHHWPDLDRAQAIQILGLDDPDDQD